jgi:hypothetical protein
VFVVGVRSSESRDRPRARHGDTGLDRVSERPAGCVLDRVGHPERVGRREPVRLDPQLDAGRLGPADRERGRRAEAPVGKEAGMAVHYDRAGRADPGRDDEVAERLGRMEAAEEHERRVGATQPEVLRAALRAEVGFAATELEAGREPGGMDPLARAAGHHECARGAVGRHRGRRRRARGAGSCRRRSRLPRRWRGAPSRRAPATGQCHGDRDRGQAPHAGSDAGAAGPVPDRFRATGRRCRAGSWAGGRARARRRSSCSAGPCGRRSS